MDLLPHDTIHYREVKSRLRLEDKNILVAGGFTYSASDTATITQVSPNQGGTGGGTLITITGTGFRSGRDPVQTRHVRNFQGKLYKTQQAMIKALHQYLHLRRFVF